MSIQKPDVATVLAAHVEGELKSQVEDIVVSRFMDRINEEVANVEREVRAQVREAAQEWTLGKIEHVRHVMDLAEDLNIQLVVTEKQEKPQ